MENHPPTEFHVAVGQGSQLGKHSRDAPENGMAGLAEDPAQAVAGDRQVAGNDRLLKGLFAVWMRCVVGFKTSKSAATTNIKNGLKKKYRPSEIVLDPRVGPESAEKTNAVGVPVIDDMARELPSCN